MLIQVPVPHGWQARPQTSIHSFCKRTKLGHCRRVLEFCENENPREKPQLFEQTKMTENDDFCLFSWICTANTHDLCRHRIGWNDKHSSQNFLTASVNFKKVKLNVGKLEWTECVTN